jgi:NAD(P)-dependent dehydrogenase (short-subunit alcohol dehydrogenase family)
VPEVAVKAHAGRVVLVTAADGEIGRAAAATFAHHGADVVACGAGELAATEQLVRTAGRRCVAMPVDLRAQRSVDAVVHAGLDAFGHIDVCVIGPVDPRPRPFADLDEQDWHETVDVALTGAWRVTRAVAPHMVQRRTGVLILTGSPSSRTGSAGLTAQVAAEHGLVGLMKCLALELGEHDIRVNTVIPGPVRPSSCHQAERRARSAPARGTGLGEVLVGDDARLPASAVAAAMSWLASEGAAHITGIELPVDGGGSVRSVPPAG